MPKPSSLLIRLLLVLGGLGVLVAAWGYRQMPQPGPERLELAPGATGVWTGQSYAWVVRTANGAFLVDTGMDPKGEVLLAELAREGLRPEQVHTVLITHGHKDHWGAAHLFPQARVLVGHGEAAVLRGQRALRSPAGRVIGLLPSPPLPARLEELAGSETLALDGESVRVVAAPGHTPGSTLYLWKDVLFTGDSLLGKDEGLTLAPAFLSESVAQNRASLAALRGLSFTRVADGHHGVTADAPQKLTALLE